MAQEELKRAQALDMATNHIDQAITDLRATIRPMIARAVNQLQPAPALQSGHA